MSIQSSRLLSIQSSRLLSNDRELDCYLLDFSYHSVYRFDRIQRVASVVVFEVVRYILVLIRSVYEVAPNRSRDDSVLRSWSVYAMSIETITFSFRTDFLSVTGDDDHIDLVCYARRCRSRCRSRFVEDLEVVAETKLEDIEVLTDYSTKLAE